MALPRSTEETKLYVRSSEDECGTDDVGEEEELVGATTDEAEAKEAVGEHEDHGDDTPLEVLLPA